MKTTDGKTSADGQGSARLVAGEIAKNYSHCFHRLGMADELATEITTALLAEREWCAAILDGCAAACATTGGEAEDSPFHDEWLTWKRAAAAIRSIANARGTIILDGTRPKG